ncbi:MAG TPA: cytochrome c oxidase subunit 3 [Terriglobales bacterium]|jgi:cytochrome c oxidase subunit III|nr:cytochrome c oxidase subunit 3 [Terriglobales bacterium]
MATTVQPPAIKKIEKLQTGSGNGGWRPLVPAGGDSRLVQEFAPPPASTGIWVGLAAITMTFAALTSALVVRKGGAVDWQHFTLPSILYLNTVVLLASSVTLELGRRRIAAYMGGLRSSVQHPARWLYVTFSLGLLFVAGQYIAWRQLSAQGLYLATNPSSSFFYVFTAGHALHVLGGLGGLGRAIRKLKRLDLRRSTFDATARYWHFMGALWVYLLVLLWMKL